MITSLWYFQTLLRFINLIDWCLTPTSGVFSAISILDLNYYSTRRAIVELYITTSRKLKNKPTNYYVMFNLPVFYCATPLEIFFFFRYSDTANQDILHFIYFTTGTKMAIDE